MILEVWHADSLAGPFGALKRAFENRNRELTINMTSGRSRELAERIVSGEVCDVFASSDPAVVKEMFDKKTGSRKAASWYVVFSANEMVVITPKGNPLRLRKMTGLACEKTTVALVTGAKDLATGRTVAFIRNTTEAEGSPELSQKIMDKAAGENTIPDVVNAVTSGKVSAGVVYLSAAISVAGAVEISTFPAEQNLSESIRNAATIPGTAVNEAVAAGFIQFILSEEGKRILRENGQPPVIPPAGEGDIPPEIAVCMR